MDLHVIIGAGVIGSATATQLAQCGHQVRLLSRSGRGPTAPGIVRLAVDATNVEQLVEASRGAAAIYNCANPPYWKWTTEWPPLAAAILGAAERIGAGLVIMSNLYGYGPLDHPMTEQDPLKPVGPKGRVRAAMWAEALAVHRAGTSPCDGSARLRLFRSRRARAEPPRRAHDSGGDGGSAGACIRQPRHTA